MAGHALAALLILLLHLAGQGLRQLHARHDHPPHLLLQQLLGWMACGRCCHPVGPAASSGSGAALAPAPLRTLAGWRRQSLCRHRSRCCDCLRHCWRRWLGWLVTAARYAANSLHHCRRQQMLLRAPHQRIDRADATTCMGAAAAPPALHSHCHCPPQLTATAAPWHWRRVCLKVLCCCHR